MTFIRFSKIRFFLFLAFLLSLGLGCGFKKGAKSAAEAEVEPDRAVVSLGELLGSGVSGTLRFSQEAGKDLQIIGEIHGLDPNSGHGFHIHEKGDCSASDGSSAGGHFNPTEAKHGGLNAEPSHFGDLGNVTADEKGVTKVSLKVAGPTLRKGKGNVVGRSIIVHEKSDDLTSQPTGAAGGRIACGVIERDVVNENDSAMVLEKPQRITRLEVVSKRGIFLVSGISLNGKGYVAKIDKERTEIPFSDLDSPQGLAMDWRRGHLFVTSGDVLKVFKAKKPEKKYDDIAVLSSGDEVERLGNAAFSLMNRRVYVISLPDRSIWEANPKTNKSAQLLAGAEVAALGHGVAQSLHPSFDGKRLWIGTSLVGQEGVKQAAILEFNLEKKKIERLKTHIDFKDLSRLIYFNNHLVILDAATKKLWALHLRKNQLFQTKTDLTDIAYPTDFALDTYTAAILNTVADGSLGQLTKRPFKLK